MIYKTERNNNKNSDNNCAHFITYIVCSMPENRCCICQLEAYISNSGNIFLITWKYLRKQCNHYIRLTVLCGNAFKSFVINLIFIEIGMNWFMSKIFATLKLINIYSFCSFFICREKTILFGEKKKKINSNSNNVSFHSVNDFPFSCKRLSYFYSPSTFWKKKSIYLYKFQFSAVHVMSLKLNFIFQQFIFLSYNEPYPIYSHIHREIYVQTLLSCELNE